MPCHTRRLPAMVAGCLLLATAGPPCLADSLYANEEWRTNLAFDLGLGTLIDFEKSIRIKGKGVEAKTDLDGLLSFGEHVLNVPVDFQLSYELAEAKGGETLRLYLHAESYEHARLPLQLYKQGLEAGAALRARTKWLWGLSDWRGIDFGVDYGIDFEGFAPPPMAGERHLDKDTIDTPITVPPPPPELWVPTLAKDALSVGSRLLNGRIEATIRSENTDAVLHDCDGNPRTTITLTWHGRNQRPCVALQIPNTIQQGAVAVLGIRDVSYTVDNQAVFAIVPWILGWSPGEFPLGSLQAAPITANGSDHGSIEIPLEPSIQENLVAHGVTFSRPPNRLEPDVEHFVTGYVLNYSDQTDINDAFSARLDVSPAGQNQWTELSRIEITRIRNSQIVPFTTHLQRNRFLPGDYELRLQVDTGADIVEFDETDNETVAPFTIVDIAPDLRVLTGTQGPLGCANEPFELRAVIENWGRATLASDPTLVVFEAQPIPDSGVIPESGTRGVAAWSDLGTAVLESVPPRETGIARLAFPAGGLTPGRHLIRVTVNPDRTQAEYKFQNNQTVVGTVYLRPTEPNLLISAGDIHFSYADPRLNPDDPPDLDTEITVWSTVRNLSCSSARDVTVQFFSLQESDAKLPLGERSIERLQARASTVVTTRFTPRAVIANAPEGDWGIETVIVPVADELTIADNSAIGTVFVGTALGTLDGKVIEAWSDPQLALGDVLVKVFEQDRLVGQARSASDGSFSLADVPTGYLTVTAEKHAYQTHSRIVEIAHNETQEIRINLEFVPQHPDLIGAGMRLSRLNNTVEICIKNIGNVPAEGPIAVNFFLGATFYEDLTLPGPVDVGLPECQILRLPNVDLSPGNDWVGGIVIDPGNALEEISDDNNVYDAIITNPKPLVTIEDVRPNPAAFGSEVFLDASASDDDGIRNYEWRSDRDGLLATTEDATVDTLSPGTHRLTFRARDQRGEWSETSLDNVEITDGTGPVVALTYSPGDELKAPADAVFEWDAQDDVSAAPELQYAHYLQGRDSGYGSYSTTRRAFYQDLGGRRHYTLHVKARDAAGNESDPLLVTFEVRAPGGGGGSSPFATTLGIPVIALAVLSRLLLLRRKRALRQA